jgi:uncharacterized protein YdaT
VIEGVKYTPWYRRDHAGGRKLLPPCVWKKAIEIVTALPGEGMDKGLAIRIAIAKAKQWA